MKNKSSKQQNKIICEMCQDLRCPGTTHCKPIVDYQDANMECRYYWDGSGEVEIFIDGKQIFFRDDGGFKYHIKYVEEFIKDYKKKVKQMEKCLPELKALKKKYKL